MSCTVLISDKIQKEADIHGCVRMSYVDKNITTKSSSSHTCTVYYYGASKYLYIFHSIIKHLCIIELS